MSLIFFSVSNEIPEQPVVSSVSGAVFEKRLIEKYINENGCDPINSEPLELSQLIEIKGEWCMNLPSLLAMTRINCLQLVK